MSESKIEWTERTWNPVVGCSVLTPGCTNCYAMKMAARIEAMKRSHYDGTTRRVKGNAVWTGKLALAPDHILLEPLRRKKPTTYFVNSMGDLFHEAVPDEWIDKCFITMAEARHHTFQILTKRADRMRGYMTEVRDKRPIMTGAFPWPLPNVWLGVSAERQQEADERIPLLLQTPAAIRFVSAEPLLGPIDLTTIKYQNGEKALDAVSGGRVFRDGDSWEWSGTGKALDWIIVGGESGPNARPMHPDWARSIRDQCAAAGVAFFFKQWGTYFPDLLFGEHEVAGMRYTRASKKVGGRTLDGIEHNAMPSLPSALAATPKQSHAMPEGVRG